MTSNFIDLFKVSKKFTNFFDLFKVSKQSFKKQSFTCHLKHKNVDLKPTEDKTLNIIVGKKLESFRI